MCIRDRSSRPGGHTSGTARGRRSRHLPRPVPPISDHSSALASRFRSVSLTWEVSEDAPSSQISVRAARAPSRASAAGGRRGRTFAAVSGCEFEVTSTMPPRPFRSASIGDARGSIPQAHPPSSRAPTSLLRSCDALCAWERLSAFFLPSRKAVRPWKSPSGSRSPR